ncbi:MAG TPA: MG2 domain-containing protein, partial [Bacteroidales bacterium]|nr:MG2 domain-containing protein [Bacteroidales bacterium]
MTVTKLSALVLLTLFNALSFGSSFHSPSDDSLKIIEKVYLHTDRITYYPGDDIWFKAYLIDASERLLSNYSRNLHVELISPSSGIINSHILNIVNGLANGDLHLSENLKSGEYRLRAYTNYMRNFGEELFFNKSIIIINPADSARALSNHKIDNTKLELTFYPEGGSLVENVASLVAFKA